MLSVLFIDKRQKPLFLNSAMGHQPHALRGFCRGVKFLFTHIAMRPSIGQAGLHVSGAYQKQGTIETGFEPAITGYEPAAKPFSYSNLLFVPFKTQFFRFMRDSNPRLPGYEPGAPQLELIDPEKIAVCVFL